MVAVPDKQDQQDPDRAEAAAADRAKKEIAIIRAHKEVAELHQQQRDERKRAERSTYRRGVTAEPPAAARRNLQELDLSSIARPPSDAGMSRAMLDWQPEGLQTAPSAIVNRIVRLDARQRPVADLKGSSFWANVG